MSFYEAAGVSLGKAEAIVERLRAAVASTGGDVGGFAGLYPLDEERLLAALSPNQRKTLTRLLRELLLALEHD